MTEPEEWERQAEEAFLAGRDETGQWTNAYRAWLRRDEPEQAARCAFWLAFGLLNRGEAARGAGWLTRARRLVDGRAECVAHGYLLLPDARGRVLAGDYAAGQVIAEKAAAIGSHGGEPDLVALARHIVGRALIRLDKPTDGMSVLDELMAGVLAGEVSDVVAGDVFCGAIEACQETFDLRRAREWTAALTAWCAERPDLVPYTGQCQVHRAEILRLHGAWLDALAAAREATERLAGQPAAGAAWYELAETHRLRGELTEAEDAYRQANRWGRRPQPGLALLRLAQRRIADAQAAIEGELAGATDRATRCRLLPAAVEIFLAAQGIPAARGAADELAGHADAPMLTAAAGHAHGAVLLAEGAAKEAAGVLRTAWTAWHELDAPYEAARVRVLLAAACRALGDEDTARMELDAAEWVFARLGVLPAEDVLTGREKEVLRLVATGRSNKAVAAALFLSEKTVARHVSNIFGKLGVHTRAAATAYAYEHDLV
jgi:DNA-binding CsgD family transcriptional regulator